MGEEAAAAANILRVDISSEHVVFVENQTQQTVGKAIANFSDTPPS